MVSYDVLVYLNSTKFGVFYEISATPLKLRGPVAMVSNSAVLGLARAAVCICCILPRRKLSLLFIDRVGIEIMALGFAQDTIASTERECLQHSEETM